MAGHISLAIPTTATFFAGLALIVVGTGLLKPNVSAMVGDLYPEGGARRDAGFSIFYTGINLGSFLGVTLVGIVGEGYNFHWGFSLAALGMFLGLVQYKVGGKHIEDAGNLTADTDAAGLRQRSQRFYLVAAVVTGLALLLGYLMANDLLGITLTELAAYLGYAVVGLAVLYFAFLFVAGGLTGVEKKRLGVIVWLFVLAAVFWSGFEQAGSSLNLFARDFTDRSVGGWEMPASPPSERQRLLYHPAGARVRRAVDVARAEEREPVDSAQVWARPVGAGRRVLRAGVGRGERDRDGPGRDVVAYRDLLFPHGRRAEPEPGRPQLDDEAGAGRAGSAR